jgi:hypothetical protein
LTTYPIASPISRRTTIAPYAQSGVTTLVCVTVLVAVWVEIFVSVDCGAVVVVVLVTVD